MMEMLLDRHIAATGDTSVEEGEISGDTERELRALGYLQ